MHFGDKLRQLRKSKEWTQPQSAEAIGIEQSYLSKLENGKSTPSADIFQLILKAYEIDTLELLDGIDPAVVHRQLRQIPEVANFLSVRQATNLKQRKRWLMLSALSTIVGIVLAVSSHFGLIFPNVQYTYISKGVVLSGESKEIFHNYHAGFGKNVDRQETEMKMRKRFNEKYLLLSSYRGEIFNVPEEGGSRTYRLRARKEESAVQNRYLMVTGLFFLLSGIFGFVLERKITQA
ncbi:helix-turn-helix domain-containing protein [Aliikangiella coralliicola]|uniref:Helix-turn-helix transcriptional regulator n=1 Tax=Aliikangiella coralliicola TaxID=2592383 RepID=A0A545UH24_9GAMM|nr:helix-turn-helix transcriptional regulator [Aliikangiella coralliicola]TQV88771.1 helix-turn-helix transcriptional regulator [Aliikangiella coralliicola]